jgi:D-aminoacyl-tRNA deacylase
MGNGPAEWPDLCPPPSPPAKPHTCWFPHFLISSFPRPRLTLPAWGGYDARVRAVVQRVSRAEVTVGERVVGRIGAGLLVLIGVAAGDTEADAVTMAEKIAGLRVFADAEGRMNLGLQETGGEALLVSQFTLLGDVRKGRRPSFTGAAAPEEGRRLFEETVCLVQQAGVPVETGEFGSMMQVALVNDGPVTILLDSRRLF